MKVKMYRLIERLIDEGIEAGWQSAHKYTPYPTEDRIKHCIERYTHLGFMETFEFDQEES